MREDAFSQYHPLVNFVFFVFAIGFGVVIQHPAYLAVGVICASAYLLLLKGRRGLSLLLGLVPAFLFLSAINPLFNTAGEHRLFTLFGRPYTWEALVNGMAVSAIFVIMMLWFSLYSAVLTADKFTALFGRLIPSLSLLLVMVFRLIPAFIRKGRQILDARKGIGKGTGEDSSFKQKLAHAVTILSALTDWALEGSVVTADSMRSRGYGSTRRTQYRLWRMGIPDLILLALEIGLALAVILLGRTDAVYTPDIVIVYPSWGLLFYGLFLMIPIALEIKEALLWRFSLSKM